MGLAGEDLAGVEAGAGAGKKAKAETRVVFQIMHTPTRATPTIESFTPNGSRKSDLVVICLHESTSYRFDKNEVKLIF